MLAGMAIEAEMGGWRGDARRARQMSRKPVMARGEGITSVAGLSSAVVQSAE